MQIVIPVTGEGQYCSVLATESGPVIVRHPDFREDSRGLIAINACGSYSRGAEYKIRPANPDLIKVVASGWHPFGDAGRLGGGEHVLLIAKQGAEIYIPAKYGAGHWLVYDGSEWRQESKAVRSARLAAEAAKNGKGEWL